RPDGRRAHGGGAFAPEGGRRGAEARRAPGGERRAGRRAAEPPRAPAASGRRPGRRLIGRPRPPTRTPIPMRDHDRDYTDDVEPALRDRLRETSDEEPLPIQRPRLRRRSRGDSDRETLKQLIRDLPSFVKLLLRLYRDPRVSRVDKGIVL